MKKDSHIKAGMCVATKDIKNANQWAQIIEAFVEAGATIDASEYDYAVQSSFKYVGVDANDDEIFHYDYANSYSEDENTINVVTVDFILQNITKALTETPTQEVNALGGVKHDQGKTEWTLLPWKSLKEIVDVLTFGKIKYSRDNWKNVEPDRYKDALLRHIFAWLEGEKLDPESGKHHLAHAGCCLLFLLWFEAGQDDKL